MKMTDTIEELEAWIIHYRNEIENYDDMIKHNEYEIKKLKKQIQKIINGDKK